MNWLAQAIPTAWQSMATEVYSRADWQGLADFLEKEQAEGRVIYPPREQWFTALEVLTPQDVKVVIVGQDPYHGAGEAHGLSFSVPQGVRVPPSLANIYKEIARDLGHTPPRHGSLLKWAEQGVLLLNTSLTVEADRAGSHAKKGWAPFTDALICQLASQHQHLVFMLWGAHAQKKAALIPHHQHLILQSAHPSPLSAHRGFLGNGHFSAANTYLQQNGRTPIDWQIN